MEYTRMPPWMMTLRQVEAIESLARRSEKSVKDFVIEALSRFGPPRQTVSLKRKLLSQLEWLLAGKPPEAAPYYESFSESWEYPFKVPRCYGPQVDVTIDDFINEVAR